MKSNTYRSLILFLVLPFVGFEWSHAGSPDDPSAPQMTTTLLLDSAQIKPGESVLVGVKIVMEAGWHIYWKTPGEAGLATSVKWTLPSGVTASDLQWPKPAVFQEDGDITVIGYKNETVLLSNISVPPTWPTGKPVPLQASVKWLVCKHSCIPGGADVQEKLNIGSTRLPDPKNQTVLAEWLSKVPSADDEEKIRLTYKSKGLDKLGTVNIPTIGFLTALFFAFIGGLLLNVMPCVLPVLSIKMLRLVKQRESNPADVLSDSLAYAGGILASFWSLALIVILLKTLGKDIGWGFQFQEPRFVVLLTAVVFTFALSFFGIYEFNLTLSSSVTGLSRKGGRAGAFWEGVLATALSTPCSAPFLGPALGFSFSQSSPVIFIFFTVIGLGLTLPYLLLAIFPSTTRFLPKPGTWMETLKELMGFPLLATALWLLWVLSQQTGAGLVIDALIFLFSISIALWILRKWRTQMMARVIALLIVVASYFIFVEPGLKQNTSRGPAPTTPASDGIRWEPFSLKKLEESLIQEKTVFIDFTADWCLTCKVNERNVLSAPTVVKALNESNVTMIKADWTNRDHDISELLKKLGRSGVPAYVFFYGGDASKPVLLPELLTEKILLEALARAH